MRSDRWLQYTHTLLPKRALTVLAGLLANVETPWIKNYLIKRFIRTYHIDLSDAVESRPEQYKTFNAFFIRALKPGTRPVAQADMVCPVDGYISEFGAIHAGRLLQAKQREYSVHELLAVTPSQASEFDGGSFATLYLSPRDYHRVHMPVAASLQAMSYIPGQLFSVQPSTARVIPKLFARNERVVVWFDTEWGPLVMVLVGATIVGKIATAWHGEFTRQAGLHTVHYEPQTAHYAQAQEMGYFKLGSTVILLWTKQAQLHWAANLKVGDAVRQGQALAQAMSSV
jgi:phosphatidylserine decarboxylase